MKRKISFYIGILSLILIISLLYSDEKVKILTSYAKCPICNYEFEAYIIDKPDTLGKQDTDFLTRSFYSNPIANTIWICPKCFFSALPQDFLHNNFKIKSQLQLNKINLKKDLNLVTQNDIPAWLKYENALIYYKSIKANDSFITNLHIKASWACRLESIDYTTEMDEIGQKIFKEFFKSANTSFEVYYEKMAHMIYEKLQSKAVPINKINIWKLVQADFLRKSGNHLKAYPILQNLKSVKSFYKEHKPQIDRSMFLCEKEKYHQKSALSYLVKELSSNSSLNTETKYNMTYLAGELSRRIGNDKDAIAWFKKAIELIPNQHPLHSLTEMQLVKMGRGSASCPKAKE